MTRLWRRVRQCRSTGPYSHLRCQLPRRHDARHRNGVFSWRAS